MTYNVLLVSGIQQSESVIQIHICTLIFKILSHIGHYRVLSGVYKFSRFLFPILYLIACICQSQSPNLSLPSHFLVTISCLPLWLYVCFINKFVSTLSFRFHKWYDICLSVSDFLHSVWQSLKSTHVAANDVFILFPWLSNIPLYICTTSSLSFPLSMDT